MKISKKLKSYSLLSTLLGFGIVSSTSFAIQNTNDNNTAKLVTKANELTADKINLKDVGTSKSLFNSIIRDANNNFITNNKTSIIKLDGFGKPMYALDFDQEFSGYEIRQIVEDYISSSSNKRSYYILLVNENVNIHVKRVGKDAEKRMENRKGAWNDNTKLAIGKVDNPAHVIKVEDDLTKFTFNKNGTADEITDFVLDAPILPKDLNNLWYNAYYQRDLTDQDVTRAAEPFPFGRIGGNNTEEAVYDFGNGNPSTSIDNSKLNTFQKNKDDNTNDDDDGVKGVIKSAFQLDEKISYPQFDDTDQNEDISVTLGGNNNQINTWNASLNTQKPLTTNTLKVIDRLYLNSVNSLSFIGNSIYIFGSNELPSLWYYAFPTKRSDLVELSQVKAEDNDAATTDTGEFTGENTLKTYRSFGMEDQNDSNINVSNSIDASNWANPEVIEGRAYFDYKLGIDNEQQNKTFGGSDGDIAFNSTGSKTVLRSRYENGVKTNSKEAYLYVFGYQLWQFHKARRNKVFEGDYSIVYNTPYSLLEARRLEEIQKKSNDFKPATLPLRMLGGYLTASEASERSKIPYIKQGSGERKIFESAYSDNTFSLDRSLLGFDGIRNTLNIGFKATSIVNLNSPVSGSGLESVAAMVYYRGQIAIIQLKDEKTFYNAHSIITTSPIDTAATVSNIKNIYPGDGIWYFLFKNKENKTSLYTLSLTNGGVSFSDRYDRGGNSIDGSSINAAFTPTNLADVDNVNAILPLLSNAFYSIDNSGSVALYSNTEGNPNEFAKNDSFDASTSKIVFTQEDKSKPVYSSKFWGTIEFKGRDFLQTNGYFQKTAKEYENNQNFLDNLIKFTPAYSGQKYRVVAVTDEVTNSLLKVKVQIQYLDGKYYDATDSSLANQDQQALVYGWDGFASLPSWVIPAVIGGILGLVAILIILGLSIGIPMRANRKLQDKGFKTTFKKVDTLTSAVGSVYKKIISQTANVKKKPAALGAAKTPAAKPGAPKPAAAGAKPTAAKPAGAKPTAPGAKPGAPTSKPGAPSVGAAAPKPTAPKK
ncbi:cytadherence protein A [Mycoplasma sp. E35C]|uniref:cytadherence protein A n=1 Tax=Mycoplasma sp. E35C TaxID=2801918 RepID=UPI001CA3A862|nr:cytadherence protein A [Mycoplasma sp. E35C]QZX49291.1 cytadherence protein A [Mycoplasma sp. E35C]